MVVIFVEESMFLFKFIVFLLFLLICCVLVIFFVNSVEKIYLFCIDLDWINKLDV